MVEIQPAERVLFNCFRVNDAIRVVCRLRQRDSYQRCLHVLEVELREQRRQVANELLAVEARVGLDLVHEGVVADIAVHSPLQHNVRRSRQVVFLEEEQALVIVFERVIRYRYLLTLDAEAERAGRVILCLVTHKTSLACLSVYYSLNLWQGDGVAIFILN